MVRKCWVDLKHGRKRCKNGGEKYRGRELIVSFTLMRRRLTRCGVLLKTILELMAVEKKESKAEDNSSSGAAIWAERWWHEEDSMAVDSNSSGTLGQNKQE